MHGRCWPCWASCWRFLGAQTEVVLDARHPIRHGHMHVHGDAVPRPSHRCGVMGSSSGSAWDTLPMSCCGMHPSHACVCSCACMDVGLSEVSALTKRPCIAYMHACMHAVQRRAQHQLLKAILARFLAAPARAAGPRHAGARHRQARKWFLDRFASGSWAQLYIYCYLNPLALTTSAEHEYIYMGCP